MALARNLKKNTRRKIEHKKSRKYIVFGALFIAIAVGAYGIVNIIQLTPDSNDKKEINYETGDRPLPQIVKLWVVAEGGLYLREDADSESAILKLIPDGTELEALETKDDWYKVKYMDKEGWVHKDYTTTKPPEESPTKGWNSYKNDSFKYTLQYPEDWVAVDYGKNDASNSESYVGLGLQLPSTLDPAKLPPIIIRVTNNTKAEVTAIYSKKTDVVSKKTTISGVEGTKYTYTSSSGTQITTFVVTKGSNTFILEESGGYSNELSLVVGSINLP